MVSNMLSSLFRLFDSLVILDTETTGLDCKVDEIIEIATLRVVAHEESFRIENEFDALIQLSAGGTLPKKITDITGITEQMLSQYGKTKESVYNTVAKILNNPRTLIIAYNAQFDLCFLYFFLLKHKGADVLKQARMLDVMTIYKDRRDYPHKLSDAVNAYMLKYQNSHRAIEDVNATFELLIAMDNEKNDLHKYINLFGYNPKYGISGPRISSITYIHQGYNRDRPLYEQSIWMS